MSNLLLYKPHCHHSVSHCHNSVSHCHHSVSFMFGLVLVSSSVSAPCRSLTLGRASVTLINMCVDIIRCLMTS